MRFGVDLSYMPGGMPIAGGPAGGGGRRRACASPGGIPLGLLALAPLPFPFMNGGFFFAMCTPQENDHSLGGYPCPGRDLVQQRRLLFDVSERIAQHLQAVQ